ncbi:hypothetical protein CkaCkLH20_09155 [Colletotrichum karsti]|uniref:Heterokaryon incompatibility domain-containing protein n=1 Tax=Colletotrichum karsti TaxID=1095194 RepID=A0A9P6HY09_9PEZI|nr:uncharacterized protein CkaCkLH20_09155 [Colletotrichum karsti]KAF9873342.1 hypothetical protein CkaCkLH20_09155 [Colletotrichum karsti]
MWLIDTDTLRLVGVQGDPQEDYAILSHTWGRDEVTFSVFQAITKASERHSFSTLDDMREHIGVTTTSGYGKIKDSAKLAKAQGLKYLWVDTCCIDKTSSAELSESINSMYRWYQKAKVCYAFLPDVEPVAANDPFEKNSSFRKSRWFTRGWTLQELIAPTTVEFYAKDWSLINTKNASNNNFCDLLMRITGINASVLGGTTFLSDISVANRMQWSATRETTRIEDLAYCLLGIFNVNMPLLYGEGMRAFIRLQEEILRETDDQSLFLWGIPADETPDGDTLYGLLAPSPRAFSQLDLDRVRPLPPSGAQQSTPASVTSQGLRTSLQLFPFKPDSDIYYALLDCVASRSQDAAIDWSPCIIVQRLWGDQFARITSAQGSVALFPEDSLDENDGTLENVYVKQSPFHALPELAVQTKSRRGDNRNSRHLEFRVASAYPPERWDSTLSIIRPKEPQSGRPFVVLRFVSDGRSITSTMDVSIGLRRVQKRWELCYEKLPYADRRLNQVFYEVSGLEIPLDRKLYDPNGLKCVRMNVTEANRRGRRFIQIGLSGAIELDSASTGNATALEIIARRPRSSSHEISEITRQCFYEQGLSYVLTPEVRQLDAVRTRPPHLKYSPGYSTASLDAVEIDPSKPYAKMIKAVRARKEREIKSLVSKDPRIVECETEEQDNFRPIHWAAALGSQSLVKTLIKLGADKRSKTKSGYMAIHLAIFHGRFNLVAYLLEEEQAIQFKASPDTLYRFLTDRHESVLHILSAPVSNGFAHEGVRKAIENVKAEMGGVHSMSHMNWLGETPLHRAAASGDLNGIKFLTDLSAGAGVRDKQDNCGRSVLFHAACGGSRTVIDHLLDLGAMLDLADEQGRSPLHAAVMANNPEAIHALLSRGANVNNVTHEIGLTPLHLACLYGFSTIVQQLRGAGARVNQWTTGSLSCQPLHLSVANGHHDCVYVLVNDTACEVDSRCSSYLFLTKSDSGLQYQGDLVKLQKPLKPVDLATSLGLSGIASTIQKQSTYGINRSGNGSNAGEATPPDRSSRAEASSAPTGPLIGLLGLEMLSDD